MDTYGGHEGPSVAQPLVLLDEDVDITGSALAVWTNPPNQTGTMRLSGSIAAAAARLARLRTTFQTIAPAVPKTT